MPGNVPDFDPARLDLLADRLDCGPGKSQEPLIQIVELYLQHTAQSLADLKRAVGERDLRTVQRTAHSLKSSSANLGVLRTAEICRALEKEAKNGRIDNGVRLADDGMESFERAARELRSEIARRRG